MRIVAVERIEVTREELALVVAKCNSFPRSERRGNHQGFGQYDGNLVRD